MCPKSEIRPTQSRTREFRAPIWWTEIRGAGDFPGGPAGPRNSAAGGRAGLNFHLTLPEFRRGGLLINVLFGGLSGRGRPSKKNGKPEKWAFLCIFVHFRAFFRISRGTPQNRKKGGFRPQIPTIFLHDFRAPKMTNFTPKIVKVNPG
jgi:hypothetical protein